MHLYPVKSPSDFNITTSYVMLCCVLYMKWKVWPTGGNVCVCLSINYIFDIFITSSPLEFISAGQ